MIGSAVWILLLTTIHSSRLSSNYLDVLAALSTVGEPSPTLVAMAQSEQQTIGRTFLFVLAGYLWISQLGALAGGVWPAAFSTLPHRRTTGARTPERSPT